MRVAPQRLTIAAAGAAMVSLFAPRLAEAASYLVTSTADSGAGTLRQAITSANASAGADSITFAIGNGTQQINLASALPAVTDALILDGTAPAAFPTQVVALYGSSATGDCLVLSNHTGSTLRKLVITNCSAANAAAVHITGGGSHAIEGCFLGPDASGESYPGGNQVGLLIDGGSTNNTVGGTLTAQRNVISGNKLDAVVLDGAGTTANTILGNYIGLDANGATSLTNSQNGITVHAAASGNTIGGATAGARNVIAGQNGECVELDSSGNLVQGNYLGTNAAGLDSLTITGVAGIYVTADGNTIGGTAPGAGNLISGITQGQSLYVIGSNNLVLGNFIGTSYDGMSGLANGAGVVLLGNGNQVNGNLISGNGNWAIEIQGETNTVQGNWMGTDATGNQGLSNFGGVWIQGNGNILGGAAAGARNVIADSEQQGVYLQGSGNVLQGNYIGVGTNGTKALGNQGNGIEVHGGAFPDAGGAMGQNAVGGTGPGEGNVIANNVGTGVVVYETGASIEGNSIYANGRLGIDLGGDGVTMNHPGNAVDGGSNGLQNFPLATQVTSNGTSTFVSGTLATSPNGTFHVEVFFSATADPSGYGQGAAMIGAVDVTTDGSGMASWMITAPEVLASGSWISATATNALGETSEFGPDLLFGTAADAGTDAGGPGMDAAAGDGGTIDGGAMDGGAIDGSRDGAGATDGPPPGPDGATGMDATAGTDAETDSGGASASGGSGSSGGCGCLVGTEPPAGGILALLVAGQLIVAIRRRRRRII